MTVATLNPTTTASSSGVHPLDPLNDAEIVRAAAIVRAGRAWSDLLRFVEIQLHEPAKADVLAWEPDSAVDRRAFVVAIDRTSGQTWETVVNLSSGTVETWKRLTTEQAPFGQCAVMVEEFARAEDVVKADPRWRAAMHRRGLSDADIDLVQVDPFSAGFFDDVEEAGHRLVRAVSYYRKSMATNAYAHPIEGVVAVVDLNEHRVLRLIDDETIIPIPPTARDYDTASLPPVRTDLKPLHIVQPEGASFSVEGWQVRWQNWSFRVGFTSREGLVLHQVAVRDPDTGIDRSVLYRASVTEMVVPYADPTTNHYWKSAFDAGEYGLGRLANSLALGCDCLGLIHYFDVPSHDDNGNSAVLKSAICMHEEDYGILWKHHDFRAGIGGTRRSRRLVVSFFATVGNYDYGFYWYFYQDGTIQLEAKLTGIIQTAAVPPGEDYRWGGMVDTQLGGPTHQHFFNARLHMAVDGEGNSVSEHEFRPVPTGPDNPYGNVFAVSAQTLTSEPDSGREACGKSGRYWKIFNPNRRNKVGKNPGYKLSVQASPLLMAQPDSHIGRRGAFASKHLWVTAYDPAERFASGDYPNQHAGGDGVPAYVQQDRPIENADIVVWHSFGHTHVCKPEDFPIMPVEYAGFTLKPNGFFGGNTAMDLPAKADSASVRHGAASDSCCGTGASR